MGVLRQRNSQQRCFPLHIWWNDWVSEVRKDEKIAVLKINLSKAHLKSPCPVKFRRAKEEEKLLLN